MRAGSDVIANGSLGVYHLETQIGSGANELVYSFADINKPNHQNHISPRRLELMVSDGISAKRLSARGFGEQRPIQPNETKEGKAANRRVEIYVIAAGM